MKHKVKGSATVEASVITPIILGITLTLLVNMLNEMYKASDLFNYQFMISYGCNLFYQNGAYCGNLYQNGVFGDYSDMDDFCTELVPRTSQEARAGFQVLKLNSSNCNAPLTLVSCNMIYRAGNRVNDKRRIEREE